MNKSVHVLSKLIIVSMKKNFNSAQISAEAPVFAGLISLFDRYFYGQNTNNVKTIYEKRAEFRNLDISKRLN